MSDKEITSIIEQLAELLIKNNKQLTVAESCTGGWVAKVLTDLAGSSTWFERGFVTYSNEAKREMLAVAESTLEIYGAVSEETVVEMAQGALKNSHADVSLSISGIAGPDGGSVEKPVGLVWFAWCYKFSADKDNKMLSEQKFFSGDRDTIRKQAVVYALNGLLKIL
jgi:nicotinamide-nucleotide amidase